MEKEEKKTANIHNRPGLDERIRNTAELLAGFARENLDKKFADEIVNDLAGIVDNDSKKDDE